MTESASPESLFDQIQQKLESAQASAAEKRTLRRELDTLYRITELMRESKDLDSLLGNIVDLALDLTRAERGLIILTRGEKQELAVRVARNMQGDEINQVGDISRGIVRTVIDSRETFLSVDAQHDERLERNRSIYDHEIQSLICSPIIVGDEVLGVLYVDSQKVSGLFNLQQREFMDAVSGFAGVVIRKAELEQALQQEISNKTVEVDTLRQQVHERFHQRQIIGQSPAIRKVLDLIDTVAASSANILIIGESGTGKELIARAIHHQSPRSREPFVAINCAALPENLLETELFGHEKGAFTNAFSMRKGKFEVANGGTIFLDEIGDMSPVTQAKVLRAIQEREFTRVGGNKTVKVDIRIVAATNKNLVDAVKAGDFREDLYFRLNVITFEVPPLRERIEDIPLLADHFLKKYANENESRVPTLTLEAREALMNYPWEGNIRELESAINHGMVLCSGDTITLKELPPGIAQHRGGSVRFPDIEEGFNAIKERHINDLEQSLLKKYLEATKGNIAAAARMAKMSRVNFYRLLKKFDLQR